MVSQQSKFYSCIICNTSEIYASLHKKELMDAAAIIPRPQSPLCHYFTGSIYRHSYSWQLGQLETQCRCMFSFPTKLKYFLMRLLINHWRNHISLMVLWVSNKRKILNHTFNQVKLVLATWHFFIFLMAKMRVIFLVKHSRLAQWTILLFTPKCDPNTAF
jgi:hypothetical protein